MWDNLEHTEENSDKIEAGIPNLVNISLYNTLPTLTASCGVKGRQS
jgi:hypothetical protein